ncbi:DUF192 domain-containing protein [Candidatus Viridilinea mediisalina]|uniref:DUF192 domain-containing protein n=1 Tax=Candidatus Viridilinea mediisalina TaxID=2024553 RepID=A0A2A6RNZ4_9CHLR|nr:DUF192 domain-containing protein [Candidatus Viridilinea mediisalina]PDW04824.1 hypothetical protein CJ255_01920 [Candidatus Viridilinea mediisalina]
MPLRVVNQTRGTNLAEACAEARSFVARGRGLMGHPGLAPGEGLLIDPCSSVHSFFMRFPIDVVFVDRHHRVVGLTVAMPPNRPFAGAWGARYVVELPAGTIEASATELGDQLALEQV